MQILPTKDLVELSVYSVTIHGGSLYNFTLIITIYTIRISITVASVLHNGFIFHSTIVLPYVRTSLFLIQHMVSSMVMLFGASAYISSMTRLTKPVAIISIHWVVLL